MDFVHDTLADGRPFRVLTVVDTWNRHSPVLKVGFRMSGETVGQALDRALNGGSDHAPLRSIMARNFNHGRSKIGPITEACNSTSFGGANPWRMPVLNPLTAACETSV
jgi:hypothetical protein